jgi:anaerobic dimethyl sulfoxide reductase subunit B (iron-sulfur subunit)
MPGEPVQWRRVTSQELGKFPDLRLVNSSRSCLHCGKPACLGVCPTGAITKRPADGIVLVDKGKCIGCRRCLAACPFGVPQYGVDGTMQKCNLCLEKVRRGKTPECGAACTTGALSAGPLDEIAKAAARKSPQRFAGATQPSLLVPAAK